MGKKSRREFIKTIGGATASSLFTFSLGTSNACFPRKKKHPNVIIVLTDDQGYGDIGAHGNPYVKTPTLDRLHQESVRLRNFHVDPCCSPSRASLLTGQYSARSGAWHTIGGRYLLREDKVTLANVFRSNGYKTAIFGKWHLGHNYPFRPQDRGFDEVLVHRSGVVGDRWDYWGNDYYDDTYFRNGKPERFKGYCNTIWFDEAIKFISKNRQNPFFCFISTNIPHAPLIIDEKYAELYRSKVSDRLAKYYGMITKLDEDMALLIKALRHMNLEDNTILIFMSDNGPCPWFGGIIIDEDGFVKEGFSAGMRGGKIWGYENAHRVPCYIRWPSGKIGRERDIDKLTAHFDLFPTLIEACQLKEPSGVKFDGKSLMPLLLGENDDRPERILFVHNQRIDFPEKYKDYQVLTERWRLVMREKEELYDIIEDPGQRKDVADKNPEVVKTLKERYEEWWDDISIGFDKYNEIVIGSDKENPSTLYSHDAFGRKIWVLKAEKDGRYEFKPSRWPAEANKPISVNKDGDIDFNATRAHLVIGNVHSITDITEDNKYAQFEVHLKAGTTCLQAWFEDNTERVVPADFVYLERLGSADSDALQKYQAVDPDRILKDRR